MKKILPAFLIGMALSACNKEPPQAAPAVSAPEPAPAAQTQEPTMAPVVNPVDTLSFSVASGEFNSQTGELVEGRLVNNGEAGYLLFGPYVSFSPGEYVLTIQGQVEEVPAESKVRLDVASNVGKTVHAEVHVEMVGDLPTLEFTLPEAVGDLEVRVRTLGGAKVSVVSYEVTRKG